MTGRLHVQLKLLSVAAIGTSNSQVETTIDAAWNISQTVNGMLVRLIDHVAAIKRALPHSQAVIAEIVKNVATVDHLSTLSLHTSDNHSCYDGSNHHGR